MNKANHNFISIFIWADSDDYVGCFVDSKRRLLPQQYKINGNGYHTDIENNRCLLYCKDQGYKYSGTEVMLYIILEIRNNEDVEYNDF